MVKFVLLGHMRSGSTLILHALARHPHVHIYGEIFNRSRKVREIDFAQGMEKCPVARERGINEQAYFQEGEDGAEFLTSRVFFPRPSEPLAVGFKLFYDHAREAVRGASAWEYLATNKDIRIIHLVRRNLVRTLVSLRFANRTRVWKLPKGKERADSQATPLCLDPEDFEEFFREQLESRMQAQELFKEHRTLTIEYEDDVCRHFQKTMYRIYDFLDLPHRRPLKLMDKQGRGRLRDRLSNYRELKAYFAATPYEEMFD